MGALIFINAGKLLVTSARETGEICAKAFYSFQKFCIFKLSRRGSRAETHTSLEHGRVFTACMNFPSTVYERGSLMDFQSIQTALWAVFPTEILHHLCKIHVYILHAHIVCISFAHEDTATFGFQSSILAEHLCFTWRQNCYLKPPHTSRKSHLLDFLTLLLVMFRLPPHVTLHQNCSSIHTPVPLLTWTAKHSVLLDKSSFPPLDLCYCNAWDQRRTLS